MSEISWFKYDHPDLPYESLETAFRSLARNPEANHDYELIMNLNSIKEGLKNHFYQGNENPVLQEMILFYFSRGMLNTEISYFKFISTFILDFNSDPNKFVFRLLDENLDGTL